MKKLISFKIKAEKGFLKKPDINDGMYLTYNMLHKPAILGVLGAIIGLEGYKENQKWPQYYELLGHIPVGVKPEDSDNGTFQKTVIAYNNTTGFASNEAGGNLIVREQTLINPSYTIYLLLDTASKIEKQLYENIKTQSAVFLPYLGKNDYSAWWDKDDFGEYDYTEFSSGKRFSVDTIFKKDAPISNHAVQLMGRATKKISAKEFFYFERLPIGFNREFFQYEMADFSFTNVFFDDEVVLDSTNLYELKGQSKLVYLY